MDYTTHKNTPADLSLLLFSVVVVALVVLFIGRIIWLDMQPDADGCHQRGPREVIYYENAGNKLTPVYGYPCLDEAIKLLRSRSRK